MADKNQLKIADQVDLADDDPFAELTRIMGFDPRQPARQAAQEKQAAPVQPQETAEDDFSLDLEKELLGFDLEDEVSDRDGAGAEAEAAAEATTPAPGPETPEVDFDFSAAFDAAMAAPAEAEVPLEADATAEPEAEFDLDFGLTEEDVRALDAETVQPAAAAPEDGDVEAEFDLGLTEDDVRALDAVAFRPAAPVEAAPAVDAGFDDGQDFGADFAAAMADVDMEFSADAPAPEQVETAADEADRTIRSESVQHEFVQDKAIQDKADDGEADLHLFDEDDFRLVEEEAEPPVEPESGQSTLDESSLGFSEDELRLDDAQPAEEPAADEFAFDDVDFAADLVADAAPEEALEATPTEAGFADRGAPGSPPPFELSVPRYEPRKLPISPMDLAADEYRQRETAAAPAGPEFNLEDELNALLGNIKASQAAAAAEMTPAAEPVAASAVYRPPIASPGPSADSEAFLAERMAEISGFDAPASPADIPDDLSWELDDAFAAEATAEDDRAEDGEANEYAAPEYSEYRAGEYGTHEYRVQDEQPYDARYDPYSAAAQPEAYAEDFESEEEPASADFDEAYDQPAEDDRRERPSTYYGDALAGTAIGAAASRFDSGFASRQPLASAWPPEPVAGRPQGAASEPFSPHRDPVVRGNPMKEDPLDIITALAAKYSKKEPVTPYGRAMSVAAGAAPYTDDAQQDENIDISAAFDEHPDVETVEVADQAVALADDLDIPELAEEEERPPVSAYDDLDAEFSSLLSDMNAEPRAAQPRGYDDLHAVGFDPRSHQASMSVQNDPRQAQSARKAYDDDPEPDSFALDADDLPGSREPDARYAAEEYDYDPDVDQEIAVPHHLAAESRQQPKSRGMLLAALVGGVALVGAIGAFALSFGGGSGEDAPAIVKADDGPVKVKPVNPGGATVPNQDNKVYETVAGEDAAGAPQEKLVTTAEEPMDVTPPPPAVEEDDLASASGKSEDRIEQILQEAENQTDAEIVAVTPRKVRTMVVKPDGTLVPREDEPAGASDEQTDTIAAAVPETPAPEAVPEATGALPAATPPELAPAPEETTAATAPLPAQQEPAAEQEEESATMPETAPIAPLRPADQPIDVVGEVKPDQVAAAATTAANGNWAMQIASQPSEAAAQSSYQDLARRYGNVLQGREVNIVKAEIAGKGTFWRVRVPAASRNEAIGLCENYKAAGGNCFVSR
ncbi:SPOR domain-containing protein [Mesorhizobium sp. KR9-304]|uniref:SPOR domain-containing protein n=1 Tax=Mesorhizobium sp. KR9-304 TaxID=3156614 RepID=UPI0032B61DD5